MKRYPRSALSMIRSVLVYIAAVGFALFGFALCLQPGGSTIDQSLFGYSFLLSAIALLLTESSAQMNEAVEMLNRGLADSEVLDREGTHSSSMYVRDLPGAIVVDGADLRKFEKSLFRSITMAHRP